MAVQDTLKPKARVGPKLNIDLGSTLWPRAWETDLSGEEAGCKKWGPLELVSG